MTATDDLLAFLRKTDEHIENIKEHVKKEEVENKHKLSRLIDKKRRTLLKLFAYVKKGKLSEDKFKKLFKGCKASLLELVEEGLFTFNDKQEEMAFFGKMDDLESKIFTEFKNTSSTVLNIDNITYEIALELGLVHAFKRVINAHIGLRVIKDISKDVVKKYGLKPDDSTGILYDRKKMHDVGKIPTFLEEADFTLGFLNDDEANAFMGYNETASHALYDYGRGDAKLQNLLDNLEYRQIVEHYFNLLIEKIKEKIQSIKEFYLGQGDSEKIGILASAYGRLVQYEKK